MDAVKLTVRIPQPLQEQARQRARATGRSLNQLIVDAMRREVNTPWSELQSERERVQAVLEGSGLWEPLGPGWERLRSDRPLKTHTELRESLQGIAPLSEDIIAMRGEL